MHLRCIDRCLSHPNCKFCFAQNKHDSMHNGKCLLYTGCDVTRTTLKTGRTFVIVPKYNVSRRKTTTTSATTAVATTMTTTAASNAGNAITASMLRFISS